MNQPPKAAFSFEEYTFSRFEFNEPTNPNYEGLSLLIEPSGVFNKVNNTFKLTLNFTASVSDENVSEIRDVVSLTMNCDFSLADGVNEIPDFFYLNSIAIVFPYLRAFLSTMTLQANCKLMVLPLLNLTHLEQRLREKTVVTD